MGTKTLTHELSLNTSITAITTTTYLYNSLSLRRIGGARRDRTVDLNAASVALSQLSYGPVDQHNGGVCYG